MRFRWTIRELEEATDNEILRSLVAERQSTCTNICNPLYKRLAKLYAILDKKIEKERKEQICYTD